MAASSVVYSDLKVLQKAFEEVYINKGLGLWLDIMAKNTFEIRSVNGDYNARADYLLCSIILYRRVEEEEESNIARFIYTDPGNIYQSGESALVITHERR